jgi:hypothetical protein
MLLDRTYAAIEDIREITRRLKQGYRFASKDPQAVEIADKFTVELNSSKKDLLLGERNFDAADLIVQKAEQFIQLIKDRN